MNSDDPVEQIKRALEDSPQERLARLACSTFLAWHEQLVAALDAAGVPHGEAQQAAENLITGVLGSINSGADAMTNAVATSAAAAAGATRH